MIFDAIENLNKYSVPFAVDIVKFLKENDPLALTGEDVLIKGKDLYVKILSYDTKSADDCSFETHRLYLDVQYVISGIETMQTTILASLKPKTDYNPVKEYQFFNADENISDVVVPAGHFIVFYPGEAHKPGCHYAKASGRIRKLVFKVRMK